MSKGNRAHGFPHEPRAEFEAKRSGHDADSGLHYEPVRDSAEDHLLMRRLDELHMKWPFYGSRKRTLELRPEGHEVNCKRVQRLMRQMGIEFVAAKEAPNLESPTAIKRVNVETHQHAISK